MSGVLIAILNMFLFVALNLLEGIVTELACNNQKIERAKKRSGN